MEEQLIGLLVDEESLTGNLEEEVLEGKLEIAPVEVSINNHDKLINRDLADQHPITAITGLKQELMSIKQTATSNYNILSKKINNKIRTVKDIPSDMEIGDYVFLEIKEEG